jgi:hypothetical protein
LPMACAAVARSLINLRISRSRCRCARAVFEVVSHGLRELGEIVGPPAPLR